MLKSIATAAVVAASGSTTLAAPNQASPAAVLSAIQHRDAAAFRKLYPQPIAISDVWFDDPKCTAQFSHPGLSDVVEHDVGSLLGCLATLGLAVDATGKKLTYEPGSWVSFSKVDFSQGSILEISGSGTEVAIGTGGRAPKIEPTLLASKLVGVQPILPDAETRAAIASSPTAVAWADYGICVDPAGNIAIVVSAVAPKFHAYQHMVEAAAKTWKAKPFLRNGKPIEVCSTGHAQFPDGRAIPAADPVDRDAMTPAPPHGAQKAIEH